MFVPLELNRAPGVEVGDGPQIESVSGSFRPHPRFEILLQLSRGYTRN